MKDSSFGRREGGYYPHSQKDKVMWMNDRESEWGNANSISSWKPYFNKSLQTQACPSQRQLTFFSLFLVLFPFHSPMFEKWVQKVMPVLTITSLPLISSLFWLIFSLPLNPWLYFLCFNNLLFSLSSPLYSAILLLSSKSATMTATKATSKETHTHCVQEETHRGGGAPLSSS